MVKSYPTMAQIRKANPGFFSDRNTKFFGDMKYRKRGFFVTIMTSREGSDRKIYISDATYVALPGTLELQHVSWDAGGYFVYVDSKEGVVKQRLKDDGTFI
jgi:hypothetical protein